MITRVPMYNATTNTPEYLQGESHDVLREPSVFVDRSGKTYDASKGVRMGDLPQNGMIQVPRTTWYARRH